ncbi:hypothetical protein EJ06DRAFT_553331 [Trichodelitschia bisporula]|uniref:Uncharacterized protein n=1 Tax=Trichodelitschia bisporula TaxID=703511 RepID=A0A6G1I8R7_9PEZI|nr:hypothetical protein EJ06DRAFT_553331 [Trichodelitschia bisporula]
MLPSNPPPPPSQPPSDRPPESQSRSDGRPRCGRCNRWFYLGPGQPTNPAEKEPYVQRAWDGYWMSRCEQCREYNIGRKRKRKGARLKENSRKESPPKENSPPKETSRRKRNSRPKEDLRPEENNGNEPVQEVKRRKTVKMPAGEVTSTPEVVATGEVGMGPLVTETSSSGWYYPGKLRPETLPAGTSLPYITGTWTLPASTFAADAPWTETFGATEPDARTPDADTLNGRHSSAIRWTPL